MGHPMVTLPKIMIKLDSFFYINDIDVLFINVELLDEEIFIISEYSKVERKM